MLAYRGKDVEETWPDHIVAQLCAGYFDGGDPWGSTVECFFQVASALVGYGEWLPSEWQAVNIFSPDADDEIGSAVLEWLGDGTVTPDGVREFGSYLGWLADTYKEQGLSY
jgi:hypothetical protein